MTPNEQFYAACEMHRTAFRLMDVALRRMSRARGWIKNKTVLKREKNPPVIFIRFVSDTEILAREVCWPTLCHIQLSEVVQ